MGFFSNLFAPSEPLNPLDELRKTTLPINGANELLNIIKRIENGEAYASWLVGGLSQ